MTTQVAADLRAAADVLERDGWTQRTVGTEDGCKCALGAIYFVASGESACGEDELEDDERSRAWAIEHALEHYLREEIATFNDDPDRTADEVIAALRAAADRAEATP